MATDIDRDAADRLLTTTRAVRRRLDLDRPVPREVILECIAVAQQAPTASNRQHWSFVVVTDPAKKLAIAEVYRGVSASAFAASASKAREAADEQTTRVYDSAAHLTDVLDRVPVLVIPCLRGTFDSTSNAQAAGIYGSIMPATWNFMLAARARGLGTAWTSIHLYQEKKVAELLGIPDDVTQVALIPVAYYTGDTFSPAQRPAPETITHWDTWTGE